MESAVSEYAAIDKQLGEDVGREEVERRSGQAVVGYCVVVVDMIRVWEERWVVGREMVEKERAATQASVVVGGSTDE